MRQTGILAASAAYALTYNFPRLAAVHDLAKRLESGMQDLGVNITSPAETCMVSESYLPRSIRSLMRVVRSSLTPLLLVWVTRSL